MMKTKDIILGTVKKKGAVTSSEIAKRTGISRQTVAQHLRELIEAKKLIRTGSTRNARYISYNAKLAAQRKEQIMFRSLYRTKGLEEDSVFQELALKLQLRKKLSPAAYKIANYAFTEMLNNAVEHSKCPDVFVRTICEAGDFKFLVEDKGIGVFESIRKKFGLKRYEEAVEHLLKGKQSTDPKHHSGQGIFFTSKIADRFVLISAKLRLVIDNKKKDEFLFDISENVKGTKVEFMLKQKSKKDLKALFDEYSNADYEFDKTKLTVRLSQYKSEYISRSEAKRLLFGLDEFKRIVFDFSHVPGIGQGFADEIFRVYQLKRPGIEMTAINMNPSVEFMVRRVERLASGSGK